jgi:hypothetical protein
MRRFSHAWIGILVAAALVATGCCSCAKSTPDSSQGTALLASVVAEEDAEIQEALSRGDMAEARKRLDIRIEQSLSQVALAESLSAGDKDFARQSKRAAMVVGRYWKLHQPEFAITPPVAAYIRSKCSSDEGC